MQFLQDARVLDNWRNAGGYPTLQSYGVTPPVFYSDEAAESCRAEFLQAFPQSHRKFLEETSLSFENGGYYFAHAGVDPARDLPQQRPEDLLWIRDEFLNHQGHFGKMVVHGHTPVQAVDFRSNRINIDTGAYATGTLTCLVLRDGTRELLQT